MDQKRKKEAERCQQFILGNSKVMGQPLVLPICVAEHLKNMNVTEGYVPNLPIPKPKEPSHDQ